MMLPCHPVRSLLALLALLALLSCCVLAAAQTLPDKSRDKTLAWSIAPARCATVPSQGGTVHR